MNDYISREAAIGAVKKERDYTGKFTFEEEHAWAVGFQQGITFALSDIAAIPAADVRPVVRGHWITEEEAVEKGDYSLRDACSVCGHCDWDCTESESFNYCPNCGAKMDGRGLKSAIWQVGGDRGPTFRSYEDAVAYIRTRYGNLRNVFLRKIEDDEREGEEKNEKVL